MERCSHGFETYPNSLPRLRRPDEPPCRQAGLSRRRRLCGERSPRRVSSLSQLRRRPLSDARSQAVEVSSCSSRRHLFYNNLRQPVRRLHRATWRSPCASSGFALAIMLSSPNSHFCCTMREATSFITLKSECRTSWQRDARDVRSGYPSASVKLRTRPSTPLCSSRSYVRTVAAGPKCAPAPSK
jgi:hypothetical protein